MGYMRHHAILVTGFGEQVVVAHGVAQALFENTRAPVSPLTDECVNGYRSFVVHPDGSKEGWEESDAGDKARNQFIDWLRVANWCSWAEVQYGDFIYPTSA